MQTCTVAQSVYSMAEAELVMGLLQADLQQLRHIF